MNSATREQSTGSLSDFPMLRNQLQLWRTGLAETEWTPWLIVGVAAFLRIFLLGIKPPHFDEGINGWFVDQVMKNGFYRYDPTNYHGPLHFYVLLISESLFGRNVWALRMPVVIVSIVSIWLLFKFEPFFNRTTVRVAALAMAVSPGFVFYGRYSIHEAWLLLFSMLFVLGVIGLWRIGSLGYLWCTGMGVAGMILTKETYILHAGCALIALIVFQVSNWMTPVPDARRARQTWDYVDLFVVVFVGVALIVFFYSGTFFHWSGVKGLYQAFEPWFKTGSEGHGHDKPFHYWLMLVTRYEQPILFGLLLCALCQFFKSFVPRYLAIYAVGALAAYSIVNYKTPWCIISIVWPFTLLFGYACSLAPLKLKTGTLQALYGLLFAILVATTIYAFWKKFEPTFEDLWPFAMIVAAAVFLFAIGSQQVMQTVAGVLLIGSLGQCIVLNYFRCTTDTEPYVYVQTYNDIFKLSRPLLTLAHRNPVYYHLAGHFIRTSSYPFPWILGDFPNVGYYEHNNAPDKMDADFLLVQEDRIEEVEGKLHESYYTEPLRIRAYQDTSKVYFNAKRFAEFFPGRGPDFTGAPPPKPSPPPQ